MSFSVACIILGIEPSDAVELGAVKAAYKRMALKTHPDKNLDDPHASDKFRQVAEAFQLLHQYARGNISSNEAQQSHPTPQAPVNKPFRKRGTGGPDFNPRTYSSSSMYESSFRHSYKPNDRFPHGYAAPTDPAAEASSTATGDSAAETDRAELAQQMFAGVFGGSMNVASSAAADAGASSMPAGAKADGDSTKLDRTEFAYHIFSEVFGTSSAVRFKDGLSGFYEDGSCFTAEGRARRGCEPEQAEPPVDQPADFAES